MLKFALAAAITTLFMLQPAEAAAGSKHKGHTASAKRVKVKHTDLANTIAA